MGIRAWLCKMLGCYPPGSGVENFDAPTTYVGGGAVMDVPINDTASERRKFLCAAVLARLNAGDGATHRPDTLVTEAKTLWEHIVKD